VGVSARSRLADVVYRNHRQQGTYLERIEAGASPVQEVRVLDAEARRLRYVTLTLGDGTPLRRGAYEATFGAPLDEDFGDTIRHLAGLGVLDDDGAAVRLTERGALVHDLATRAFYPGAVRAWMADRQRLAASSVNLGAPRD
jgi:oxygen-independent coproporphyrinogen-3 oxidase